MIVAAVSAPAAAEVRPGDVTAYLKARAADADHRSGQALADYAAALNAAPGNAVVALRAYRAALDAGDVPLADRAAAVLLRADAAPADSAIWVYAGALAANDMRGADAAIGRLTGTPVDFLAPVLTAWQAFARGDKAAGAGLATASNPIGRRYAAEAQALLLIATGQIDQGVTAVQALLTPDAGNFDFRIAAARLLAGMGKVELGRSLLQGDDPVLQAYSKSLADNGAKPGPVFGAVQLFDRLSADLSQDNPSALTIVLARAALRLDPHDDRIRLLLAQTLAQRDEPDLSLAALDGVDPNGPFAAIARAARVAVLDDAGDKDKALLAAQRLADGPGASASDAQRYGDALVAVDRYADAAKAYDQAIKRAGNDANWSLYLQKGGALEQAGDWNAARQALGRAVELAPDEPIALNYLGYAEIEHGGDLARAQQLLEHASALKPGDPAISDSLGWAYLQRGDVTRALPLLERAAQGQPADETIHEHLGDAYWKSGRFYEARYAWQAASISAEPDDRARLLSKIANGLPTGPIKH